MKIKDALLEKEYFGNQAVGVIIKSSKTGKILVVQRSPKVMEGGSFSITISGKVDEGENVVQAALREIKEEIQYHKRIDLSVLDVFQDKNEMYGFEGMFTFFTYIGVVKKEFTPVLNWETIKYFWWDGKTPIKGTLHTGTRRLLKKYKNKIFTN